MMSEVDHQIDRARGVLDRVSDRSRAPSRRTRRRQVSIATRLGMIAAADAVILIAAVVVGFVMPLGIFGALAVLLLLVAATLAIAFAPSPKAPTQERLRQVDLKALPAQTERWLDAQRPALPAPAMTLVDQIGLRLETLSPQLAGIGDETQAASDVRKLVGEQLPAFINDYARVPASLRAVPRNGKTPDAQLVEGLRVIEQEIADMTAQLAQGDLDSLATRGRFLEIKYRGDETGG